MPSWVWTALSVSRTWLVVRFPEVVDMQTEFRYVVVLVL